MRPFKDIRAPLRAPMRHHERREKRGISESAIPDLEAKNRLSGQLWPRTIHCYTGRRAQPHSYARLSLGPSENHDQKEDY
jgi:hypothetical protein